MTHLSHPDDAGAGPSQTARKATLLVAVLLGIAYLLFGGSRWEDGGTVHESIEWAGLGLIVFSILGIASVTGWMPHAMVGSRTAVAAQPLGSALAAPLAAVLADEAESHAVADPDSLRVSLPEAGSRKPEAGSRLPEAAPPVADRSGTPSHPRRATRAEV